MLPQCDSAEVLQNRKMLPHTSSVMNQRFLTASPQGEAVGTLPWQEIYFGHPGFGVPVLRYGKLIQESAMEKLEIVPSS